LIFILAPILFLIVRNSLQLLIPYFLLLKLFFKFLHSYIDLLSHFFKYFSSLIFFFFLINFIFHFQFFYNCLSAQLWWLKVFCSKLNFLRLILRDFFKIKLVRIYLFVFKLLKLSSS